MSNPYYVYAYLDTRKPGHHSYGKYVFSHEPFYIGKGKGRRAFYHLTKHSEQGCNPFKINKIKKMVSEGFQPIIIKVKENLSDEIASSFEKEMIATIGRANTTGGPLTNNTDGGDTSAGAVYSDKSRALMSAQRKGKKQTPAQYKANCSRRISPEHRKKISESLKGIRSLSFEEYATLGLKQIGIKRSEESKALMSRQRVGKCSESQREANKNRKPCVQYLEFKLLLKEANITNYQTWLRFKTNRPAGVPQNPLRIYSQRGDWISWDDVFRSEAHPSLTPDQN